MENWSLPVPVISIRVTSGMAVARTWKVATSEVCPTVPATVSVFSGVMTRAGSWGSSSVTMSSEPRGAMMLDVPEVERPVMVTLPSGMAVPMRVVFLKMRTLASSLPSVTTGWVMPSAKVSPEATSLKCTPLTRTSCDT